MKIVMKIIGAIEILPKREEDPKFPLASERQTSVMCEWVMMLFVAAE